LFFSILEQIFKNAKINIVLIEISNIDPHNNIKKTGFHPNGICCNQVMALNTHIENGYNRNVKTAVVFIDLTSAYDTVWRKGLLLKFLDVIPCKTLPKFLNKMLSNRFLTG